MLIFLTSFLATLSSFLRSRAVLGLENMALRHQSACLRGPLQLLTEGLLVVWFAKSLTNFKINKIRTLGHQILRPFHNGSNFMFEYKNSIAGYAYRAKWGDHDHL
jgi:hypothetical protein